MTLQADKLLEFLERLHEARIWYALQYVRDDAVSVLVCVPGERWEIDFLRDGGIDVEIFRSDGTLYAEPKISELFQKA